MRSTGEGAFLSAFGLVAMCRRGVLYRRLWDLLGGCRRRLLVA